MKFRVGIGFDIHRLETGAVLSLGGVRIPHDKGLVGHSDGDALCHAITDALLGACGADDIGQMFPDSNPKYKGAASLHFVTEAAAVVHAKGFHIANIDANILAETPKLSPFFASMREKLADALELPASDVHISAKTTEGLGDIGAGKAIAVHAVALIYRD